MYSDLLISQRRWACVAAIKWLESLFCTNGDSAFSALVCWSLGSSDNFKAV
jgi:hypothetical protein